MRFMVHPNIDDEPESKNSVASFFVPVSKIAVFSDNINLMEKMYS